MKISGTFAAFVGIIVFATCGVSEAFQINIVDSSDEAKLEVSIYDETRDETTVLESTSFNNFSFQIDNKALFLDQAYKIVYVSLKWTPSEGADAGVADWEVMEITLPILLRAWQNEDISLRFNYVRGIGESNIAYYEEALGPGTRFEQLFGSMLLRMHLSLKISNDPMYRYTVRATVSALEAAHAISLVRTWFLPPNALHRFVGESLNDKEGHRVLAAINASRLKDLLEVENIVATSVLSCAQWKDFFENLKMVYSSSGDATRIFFPDDNFLSIMAAKNNIVANKVPCD